MSLKKFLRNLVLASAVFVMGIGLLSPVLTVSPQLSSTVFAQADEEGEEEEEKPTCEEGGWTLSWFICPVLFFTDAMLRGLESLVNNLLEVPNAYVENDELKQAASRIRNLAYIIILPISLVMVIGTALGFEFVSAYTVKRALPRLLIAILFIALSFEITKFLVVLTNDIGRGISGIILGSFAGAEDVSIQSIFQPDNADSNVGGGISVLVGGIVGVGILATGSIGILLSFLFVGMIGLLVGFLLLALRQMLIVALMLIAPLAILAWIFPGNDRLWKIWWGTFSKLLLLFPLIMLLISTGKAFASIINVVDTNFVATFLKLVAYIGPFFMIPATFKFAGSTFATLAGWAQDKERGLFDRNRKYRQRKYGDNWQATRSGNRFRGGTDTNFRGRLNQALEVGSNINKAGLDPRRMRSRMRTALNDASHDNASKFMKENEAFAAFSGDDAKLWAARYSTRDQISAELEARDPDRFAGPGNARAREDATNQILRAQQETSSATFQRARLRAQAATGTGYEDVTEMLEDINETYGNDRGGAGRALAEMRSAAMNSGRVDLGAAGFGTMAGQLEALHNGSTTREDAYNTIMDGVIDSSTAGQAIYGKPRSAEQIGEAHTRRIQRIINGIASGTENPATRVNGVAGTGRAYNQDDVDEALASAMGVYDAMAQASPQNARAMRRTLTSATLTDPSAPTPTSMTVFGLAKVRESNPAFVQMRRDFGTSAAAHAAAARPAPGAAAPPPPPVGGGAPGGLPSDRRLKRNVMFVETTASGINLYEFQYLWGDTVYIGVIAQEILPYIPDAILTDSNGYMSVNYDLLGLEMQTKEEWLQKKTELQQIV